MFEHVPSIVVSISVAILTALPWWISPALVAGRLRNTASLDDVDDTPPLIDDAPRVSVILPARNEAAHIASCVRSVLTSTWPNLELIVVDDHSIDNTAELARDAAAGDMRFTLVRAPDLAPGWFGKQWACQAGQAQATGELLLFIDADTRHAPDLITRTVRLRAARGVELMSVAGRQLMETIWERAVQPSVFTLILTRYGSGAAMERATTASDVIANGQCFMLSRSAYDAIGGHFSVRDFVAEDVMIAQAIWTQGLRVSLALGVQQLRVRMYDGLGALVQGWGKNVYAGGRFAMRGGAFGRAIFPLVLLTFPLGMLLPFAVLLASVVALIFGTPWALRGIIWSCVASVGVLTSFAIANRLNRESAWRAVLAPLGGLVLLWICVAAVARGRNVRWKGRAYVAR